MINVTQTFLPSQEEYNAYLKRAWDKIWLTNRGELTLELESKLKEHLKINNIIITNNGTVPLQIALKLLGNQGEIITTPFSTLMLISGSSMPTSRFKLVTNANVTLSFLVKAS